MTAALMAREKTRRYGSENYFDFPIAALVTCLAGTIAVADASGNTRPGYAAVGLRPIGVYDATQANGAVAGANRARIRTGIYGPFDNSGSITNADRFKICYILDDSTVSRTDVGGTLSPAGTVVDVTSEGVFVALGQDIGLSESTSGGGAGGGTLDVATVAVLNTRSGSPGQFVFLDSKKALLFYDATSGATVDNIDYYATAVGGTSRWVRSDIINPIWGYQATWYISSAGNNEATGLIGAPIKNVLELTRRIGTFGMFRQPTIITVLDSLADTDPLTLQAMLAADATLLIKGTPATSRTGTVSANVALDSATNAATQVTDGATVWTSDLEKRIKDTTVGARANYFAFPLKNLGSGAARVSHFQLPNAGVGNVTTGNLAAVVNADTYAIETLPSMQLGLLDVRIVANASNAAPSAELVEFQDMTIGLRSFNDTDDNWQCDAGIIFKGCIINGLPILKNMAGSYLMNCCIATGAVACGKWIIDGGCISTPFVLEIQSGADVEFKNDVMIQAAGPLIIRNGARVNITSGLGVFDSSAQGVLLSEGACLRAAGRLWGTGNTGTGIKLCGGARLDYTLVPVITGASDYQCGSTAATLVAIDPATGAAMAAISQTWAALVAARPTGFGSNVINPVNGAAICQIV